MSKGLLWALFKFKLEFMKQTFIYFTLLFSLLTVQVKADTYTIYPVPQKIVENSGAITITPVVNVVCESGVNAATGKRLEEVLSKAGLTFVKSNSLVSDKTNILIGINDSGNAADLYATEHAIAKTVFEPSDNKFDAHILQVNNHHPQGDIFILGNESGSAYYAMATLEQLLEQRDNNSLRLVTVDDYAYTEYRGIVEGFYGRPYTVENRLSLLDFCKRYKMNVYVYGPKSDPYHLGKWRQEYPRTLTEHERYFGQITQDDIRSITAQAKRCNVQFVWAAHPAMENGISFNTSGIDQGVKDIMGKFEHMYELGMRGFGIFIDDMNYTPSGDMQAYLADQAQKALVTKFNGAGVADEDKVSPLFFVPTAYALNYGASYTLSSLKSVDKEVVIAFTGYDCFSNIRGSACQDMADRVGRNAVMWWNNPVNDDHDDRIYMREVTCHWTIEDKNPIPSLNGLMMNPMNQGQASKIALFGGADYSWNPAKFDTKTNWEAFFKAEVRNDDKMRDALRTFALNSNALVEEENLQQLYSSFESSYSVDQLPEVTDALLSETQKIYDACGIVETLKDSDNKDDLLLYEDIRCWVAKLKSMTGIISKSLTLMKGGSDLSNWTYFSDVQKEYQKLHSDSAFLVSSFEGAGTSTYERYYEVHPSQTYMEPFVDYIMDKLNDYSPQLPQRNSAYEIITNKEDLPSSILIEQDHDKVKLIGMDGLNLASRQYVGINFNSIKNAVADVSSISSGQSLQFHSSIDGKAWNTFIPDGVTPVDMAYVRIKNMGDQALIVSGNELSVVVPSAENTVAKDVRTNMPTYSGYSIQNVIDGKDDTFFWKDGVQTVGDYVVLDYGDVANRYEVNLLFNSGDYPTGDVSIELSEDNSTWESVSTFSSSDLSDNKYACNANGKQARYVRLLIKSVKGGNWFQLAEFSVSSARVTAVTHDDENNPILGLDDRSLLTGYKPLKTGYLIHQFIENLVIEKISIFHNSVFDSSAAKPSVYVSVDDKWVKKGELDDPCTVIDVSGLKNLSQLKIQWNEKNRPEIYEILPEGEEYVEKDEVETNVDVPEESKIRVSQTTDGTYRVVADRQIDRLDIYDVTGRKIKSETVNAGVACFALGSAQGLKLLKIVFGDGDVVVYKLH